MPSHHRPDRSAFPWLPVVAAVLVAVALWMSRDVVRSALDVLPHADGWWIAAAVATQVVVYVALGALLMRLQHDGLSWHTCVGLALVVFGLGGIMPASPVEGMTVAAMEMRRRGVTRVHAATALVLSDWMRFLVLAVLFAIDRVAAFLNGRPFSISLTPVVASSLLILLLVMGAATALSHPHTTAVLAKLIDRFPRPRRAASTEHHAASMHQAVLEVLGSRPNRLAVSALAAVGWIADASCLALCVKAMGDELGLDAVLIAYVVAAAVALVPFLPGGLGAVEVVVPTIMSRFGVPFHTALAATFAWRGLALIAPAIGGAAALLVLRRAVVLEAAPD